MLCSLVLSFMSCIDEVHKRKQKKKRNKKQEKQNWYTKTALISRTKIKNLEIIE